LRPPLTSPPFPYTTLFRSGLWGVAHTEALLADALHEDEIFGRAQVGEAPDPSPHLAPQHHRRGRGAAHPPAGAADLRRDVGERGDRKSTCLNSSHSQISYA